MAKKPTNKNAKRAVAKPVEVTIIKKVFGKVPEEYAFVLADGRKLKSLFDLMHSFRDMSEEVFRHHVNDMRNDFSNWVHDVFEEPELAEELKKINNKLEAEVVLLRKLEATLQAKKK